MNFVSLITAMAQKHFTPSAQVPHPARSSVPMRASQGSAVTIDIVPMVLVTSKGGLFGMIPTDHSVVAVGSFGLFDTVRYYNVYLSGLPGGFLSLACQGSKIIESRLYRLYTEVIPQTSDDWAFWLDDEGYIGSWTVTTKDEDGKIPFSRSWGGAVDQRLVPFKPIETILDGGGDVTRLYHQMMHYSRSLSDTIAEHLWVSAIGENSTIPSGISFWFGIDVDLGDIKVYPASDAPAFPSV